MKYRLPHRLYPAAAGKNISSAHSLYCRVCRQINWCFWIGDPEGFFSGTLCHFDIEQASHLGESPQRNLIIDKEIPGDPFRLQVVNHAVRKDFHRKCTVRRLIDTVKTLTPMKFHNGVQHNPAAEAFHPHGPVVSDPQRRLYACQPRHFAFLIHQIRGSAFFISLTFRHKFHGFFRNLIISVNLSSDDSEHNIFHILIQLSFRLSLNTADPHFPTGAETY